jgi:hypothetical protein
MPSHHVEVATLLFWKLLEFEFLPGIADTFLCSMSGLLVYIVLLYALELLLFSLQTGKDVHSWCKLFKTCATSRDPRTQSRGPVHLYNVSVLIETVGQFMKRQTGNRHSRIAIDDCFRLRTGTNGEHF